MNASTQNTLRKIININNKKKEFGLNLLRCSICLAFVYACALQKKVSVLNGNMRISDNKTDFLLTYISKTLPVLPINGVLLFKINDHFIFFSKSFHFNVRST